MLSRFLLARAGLATRISSRSLSSLHLAHPPRVPSRVNVRQFSAAPELRARDDERRSYPPSGRCYIANVPYNVTKEQLKDAFSEFGKVTAVNLLTSDAGMPRGVGFVHFDSIAGAVNFVDSHEADPIFVLDRQIYVEHAQPSRNGPRSAEPSDTLRILNLQDESEAEVRAMFGNHETNISAIRFHVRDINQPERRTAFIQFYNVETATEAMDAFRNQNEHQIAYAIHRQSPSTYTLTSRLSQHRGH